MKPWEQKFEVVHGIVSVERLSTVEILHHLVLLGDERIKLERPLLPRRNNFWAKS